MCVYVRVCVCVSFLSLYWNFPVPPSESHGGLTSEKKVHFSSLTWHFTAINAAHLSTLKIQHQKAFESSVCVCETVSVCVSVCESARASLSACKQVTIITYLGGIWRKEGERFRGKKNTHVFSVLNMINRHSLTFWPLGGSATSCDLT